MSPMTCPWRACRCASAAGLLQLLAALRLGKAAVAYQLERTAGECSNRLASAGCMQQGWRQCGFRGSANSSSCCHVSLLRQRGSQAALCLQYQLNQRLVAAARAELPMYGPSEDFTYDARCCLEN